MGDHEEPRRPPAVAAGPRFPPGRKQPIMRRALRALPACLLAASVVGWYVVGPVGRTWAQESGKAQPLFNGKDLTGWVPPEDKALFSVENGEIVGRTQGNLKKNEFLVTEKPYRDFVLK